MVDIILLTASWIHVLSAIVWLGGGLALEFVVIPSILKSSIENKGETMATVGKRFGKVAQISSGLIFITGIYRVYALEMLDINLLMSTSWGNFLLFKVALFFVFVGLGIKVGKNMENIPNIAPKDLPLYLKKTKIIQYMDIFVGLLIIMVAEILRYGASIQL